MTKLAKFLIILLIIFIPFIVFGIAGYFNYVKIDIGAIFLAFFNGIPFWFFIVSPCIFILKLNNTFKICLVTAICFFICIAIFLQSLWTPSVHSLIIGNEVYIKDGVANFVYHYELVMISLLMFIATALNTILFIKLIKQE